MPDSIAVVALDAADYELARRWDCENVLLDAHGPLETDSSTDHPLTTEVWPAVATGKDVSEFADIEQEWDSPVLRAASQVTRLLPSRVRWLMGLPFRRSGTESHFEAVEAETPFDALRHWPGLTEAKHLDQAWMWLNQVEGGEITRAEMFRNLRENTGEEFGWLATAASPERPLVGVHSHVVDMAGHAFARHPEQLREHYEWVDGHLAWLRSAVGELVVLSDHGMQTTALDDPNPGEHSWRATVAATDGVEGELPETIYEVADWLAAARPRAHTSDDTGGIDATREHLQELGYLS